VGNQIDKHGQPYGLTEEFTRFTACTRCCLSRFKFGDWRRSSGRYRVFGVAPGGLQKIDCKFGITNILYFVWNAASGALVLNNYPRLYAGIEHPGNPLFDMGAVDILRARERGVPRYNEFRRQLGLIQSSPLTT